MLNAGIGLDEKQRQDQGKACQYALVAGLFTLLLLYVATQIIGIAISGKTLFIIALLGPIMTCVITAIWKGAYESAGSNVGRYANTVIGGSGVYLMVRAVWSMEMEQVGLVSDRMLNDYAGMLLAGVCMVVICAVYWTKHLYDRNRFTEE